jgi:hypothetical protein
VVVFLIKESEDNLPDSTKKQFNGKIAAYFRSVVSG